MQHRSLNQKINMFIYRYIVQIISVPHDAIIKSYDDVNRGAEIFYRDYCFEYDHKISVSIASLSHCRYFNDKNSARSCRDLLVNACFGAKIIKITYKPICRKDIEV